MTWEKPISRLLAPVDHAAHHRRRLAEQGDVTRQRPVTAQAGVNIGRGHRIAEMIRPHDPQQIGFGRIQHPLPQRFAVIRVALLQFRAEQSGPVAAMVLQHFPADQQGGPGTARAQLADQGRGLLQWYGQNR
jgi:hypothetical protein